jgi:eukaryotic-like serine/threonine-protein kinase
VEPNQTLGHYRIVSRLGSGGMGEVFLARDTRLNRQVAVKMLLPALAAGEQQLKRFLQEAKVTSSLNHPNIGHLYEIGEENGSHFLVLEYVDGPTVGARLAAGPYPLHELLELAVQAADALADAHANGVLHRDIKPDNLMIDHRGQLKILDFGLANITAKASADTSETRSLAITNPGVVMGTPLYMSPEQALGRPLDGRSDLFSLGVVLYQMATAALPFAGDSGPALTDAILHHSPTPPIRINPRIPPDLDRIILRSLEKDPALRYQSASDLRADLKRLKRDSESGQHPQPPAQTAPSRRPWWAAAALAAAAAAFLAFRPHSAPPVEPSAEMTIRPILNSPTAEITPSLSPDGKTVAFAWNGEDGRNFDIYVKRIDAGNPLRLTNTPEQENLPSWSPDGEQVAFGRVSEKKWQLFTVPALGGAERLLVEQPLRPSEVLSRSAYCWHPDGKHIVYSSFGSAEPVGLFLLDLESGARKRLTNPPPGVFAESSPAFVSGGAQLAFIRYRSSVSGSVEVLTLSDNSFRSYPIEIEGSLSDLMAHPVRNELYFTSIAGIRRLSLDTGVLSAPLRLSGRAIHPSFSSDGRRLAYQQNTGDTNIWHATLARPGHAVSPAVWIASTAIDLDPRYLANGTQLLFGSTRSGKIAPWLSDLQGRNPRMVRIDGPYFGSPSPSPDGTRIVYDARVAGFAQILLVPTAGGTPKQLTTDKFENIVPSWSHDGQWVYYCSNRSGRQEIWRISPSGGPSEQVTRNGGFDSQESPDGKYLYFSRGRETPSILRRTPDGQEEMLVPSAGGRPWVAGAGGIYFLAPAGKQILYYDLATKRTNLVLPLTKGAAAAHRSLALSPDGRDLLWAQSDSYSTDITLVENFR